MRRGPASVATMYKAPSTHICIYIDASINSNGICSTGCEELGSQFVQDLIRQDFDNADWNCVMNGAYGCFINPQTRSTWTSAAASLVRPFSEQERSRSENLPPSGRAPCSFQMCTPTALAHPPM